MTLIGYTCLVSLIAGALCTLYMGYSIQKKRRCRLAAQADYEVTNRLRRVSFIVMLAAAVLLNAGRTVHGILVPDRNVLLTGSLLCASLSCSWLFLQLLPVSLLLSEAGIYQRHADGSLLLRAAQSTLIDFYQGRDGRLRIRYLETDDLDKTYLSILRMPRRLKGPEREPIEAWLKGACRHQCPFTR